MNNKIANIIVGYIKDLDWIDKIAGLTQIAKVTQGGVEKRFPISCDLTYDDACLRTGHLISFVRRAVNSFMRAAYD